MIHILTLIQRKKKKYFFGISRHFQGQLSCTKWEMAHVQPSSFAIPWKLLRNETTSQHLQADGGNEYLQVNYVWRGGAGGGSQTEWSLKLNPSNLVTAVD